MARSVIALLGASKYKSPALEPQSGVFERSRNDLRACLVSDHGFVLGDTLLDYFDDSLRSTWTTIQDHLATKLLRDGDSSNLLILIHIGHGTRSDGALRLGLPGSDEGLSGATSLTAESLNQFLCRHARQWSIILIVDACFGGAIVDELATFHDLPARGVCVLAAADGEHVAIADPDALHTAFSSALLDILRRGVAEPRMHLGRASGADEPPAHLSIALIHEAMKAQLTSIHLGRVPEPVLARAGPLQAGTGQAENLSELPILANPATMLRSVALSSSRDAEADESERLAEGAMLIATTDAREELTAAVGKRGFAVPRQLTTTDAASGVQALKSAIEDVASAQLVFADVTDFEPVAMFLLGVRSATSRGVTVCSGLSGRFERLLEAEPFHLRDVPLVRHGESDARRTASILAGRARSGFEELRDFAGTYLDLPAFDAVRQSPKPGRARLDLPWNLEGLALCPFSRHYVRTNWTAVQDNVVKAVNEVRGDADSEFVLRRTVDLPSPRIVTAALFDYIRRAQLCVVDLTSWRAGVLFELGVRYAASRNMPICLVDRDQLADLRRLDTMTSDQWNERWGASGFAHDIAVRYRDQALGLVEILGPLPYDRRSDAWRPHLVERIRSIADPFHVESSASQPADGSNSIPVPQLRTDAELRWLMWRHAAAQHERHADIDEILDDPVLGDGGRDEDAGLRYLIYPTSSPIWGPIGRTTADRQLMTMLYLTCSTWSRSFGVTSALCKASS